MIIEPGQGGEQPGKTHPAGGRQAAETATPILNSTIAWGV